MKKNEMNKILGYISPADGELTCQFTDEAFEIKTGELAFSFNGNPISPSQARLQGFELCDDIVMPETIKNRRELSEWLKGTLNLKGRGPRFNELYVKFGRNLPVGHSEFFNPKPKF